MPDTPIGNASSDDFEHSLDDMLARVAHFAREAHDLPSASGNILDGPAVASQDSHVRLRTDGAPPEAVDEPASQTPAPPVDADSSAPSSNDAPHPLPAAGEPIRPGPVAPDLVLDPGGSQTPAPDVTPITDIDIPGDWADPFARPPASMPERATRIALAVGSLLAVAACWIGYQSVRPSSERPLSAAALNDLPPPSAGDAALRRPPAASTEDAGFEAKIAIDADASTESRMVDELRRSMRAAGHGGSPSGAAFAIARYDAMGSTPPNWVVIAPLATEEVYALVPADSPLVHLGDLRGRRINVGPARGARAVSGEALYRTMFAAALPETPVGRLPRDAALNRLLGARDLDALLFFDGQPSGWLDALPEATRRRLRVLTFEPGDRASRRALRRYLPIRMAPALNDGPHATVPTLGEVTFLMATNDAQDAAAMLHAMCDRLPALRAAGHPKWREVDPALRLPVSVQRPVASDSVVSACTGNPSASSLSHSTGVHS